MKKFILIITSLFIVYIIKAQNTNYGYKAGSGGNNNTSLGYLAGDTVTGTSNTFVGFSAGKINSSGSDNSFVGFSAGIANTTGSYNSFFGYSAGKKNTSGRSNIFLGYIAGSTNTGGSDNSFIGFGAGYKNSLGNYNSFLGSSAGWNNTTGNYNNFLGGLSGYSNTTGINNSFVGNYSGYGNTTGNNNSYIGYNSGYSNSTGSNNVFLGYNAGYSETGSNKLYIDNSNTTTPLIYGDFSSDILTVNGKLGIGTNPDAPLTVYGISRYYPEMVGSHDARSFSIGSTMRNPNFINNDFPIVLATGDGNQPLVLDAARIGIGTTTPDYKLDVVGTIRAWSVKVNTLKTADFVFLPNYKLQPLNEVEAFINIHKHLPGIQSAAFMEKNGLDMGEFQIDLLQKIEELTLYTIELEKKVKESDEKLKKLDLLESEIARIKELLK